MYRCHACDAPAMMNCGCFTQVELPTDNKKVDHQTKRNPLLQQSPLLLEDLRRKKNISSGEDAIVPDYILEVIE